ncbi:OmpA family protein [Qipengyuania xiapuensis]|uniref:OmpA family protein n=1 Tax=Qipengyuania xiapuensis TaxID=2867236 RepID=A0ABX8ZRS0_9SPHN|nr:OmpA family protein [Qipengyuania xiapuensis]QZD91675.1 OmpA family protein [Qipengyuania xiapuensis]
MRYAPTYFALITAALLAGCSQSEEADNDPAQGEGSRSIFQSEDAQSNSAGVPASVLRPLETTISFADGTSDLTEAARAELATVVDSPQMDAGGAIILRGHTDAQGSDAETLQSSREKAEAVRDFLIENGVAQERIAIIPFGEQNPLAPNALPDGSPNEEGRATNRRVELTVETARGTEREQTLVETLTRPDAASTQGAAEAQTQDQPQ